MVFPFFFKQGNDITLPNVSNLVEWVAKNAQGGPRSETEVAKELWRFIQEVDVLIKELWKKPSYNLDEVKRDLSRWLD